MATRSAAPSGGNNNAYCQDNEISWFDSDHEDGALLAFTQRLIAFRRAHPVFRRRHFLHGQSLGADAPDIGWFRPDGSQMQAEDWWSGFGKAIGVFFNGETIPSPGARGERVVDDSFLVLFNAHDEPLSFTMPATAWGARWLLDVGGAPALRTALIEAIDEHPGRHVVVDLDGVEFIDSAGLSVLLGGLERARGADGDLKLVATGQGVIKVLELTGLTCLFEIHPSRMAALGAE